MSKKGQPHRNKSNVSSAAAFTGVIGVGDPGVNTPGGGGSLRTWCRREFLPAFDRLAQRCPELREFNRQERYFASVLR